MSDLLHVVLTTYRSSRGGDCSFLIDNIKRTIKKSLCSIKQLYYWCCSQEFFRPVFSHRRFWVTIIRHDHNAPEPKHYVLLLFHSADSAQVQLKPQSANKGASYSKPKPRIGSSRCSSFNWAYWNTHRQRVTHSKHLHPDTFCSVSTLHRSCIFLCFCWWKSLIVQVVRCQEDLMKC